MSVKTTGAEFKRFYSDDSFWPKDTWHEDESITVDGTPVPEGEDLSVIPDSANVKVEGGVVCGPQFDENEPSLESYFKRRRKMHTTASFVVECDIANIDKVKLAVRESGGRVT